MPYYRVYGLHLSANRPIPGLVPLSETLISAPELTVKFATLPPLTELGPSQVWYTSQARDDRGQPILEVWRFGEGAFFLMKYSEGVQFVIQRSPLVITTIWQEPLTLEDTATFLLGPVLGFTLRLLGVTCLHGSAIAWENQAIAFVGPAGAGKSTTAAAFAQLGYPILADDVLPLHLRQGNLVIEPAYPRLRLWPESVNFLFGDGNHLPRLVPSHPTWDKRYLDLNRKGYQFQRESLPLGKVYFLAPRQDDPRAPFVESVTPQQGAIALIGNTYTNYLLDKNQRAQEFEIISQLVRQVPLVKIHPHREADHLRSMVNVICQDLGEDLLNPF